jgi:hypothetical protein
MDLHKKTGIMVASSLPIRELLKEIVEETDARRNYLAGKVTVQAMVNGLVLWLGSRPVEERAMVVDAALALIGGVEQDAMAVNGLNVATTENARVSTTHVAIRDPEATADAGPERRAVRRKKHHHGRIK